MPTLGGPGRSHDEGVRRKGRNLGKMSTAKPMSIKVTIRSRDPAAVEFVQAKLLQALGEELVFSKPKLNSDGIGIHFFADGALLLEEGVGVIPR